MNRQMRRAIPPHLIEKAWEVYSQHTYVVNGCPMGSTDKLHWVCGFSTALAVITGAMDLGIPDGTPSYDVVSKLINVELPEFKDQLDLLMAQAKEKGLGNG